MPLYRTRKKIDPYSTIKIQSDVKNFPVHWFMMTQTQDNIFPFIPLRILISTNINNNKHFDERKKRQFRWFIIVWIQFSYRHFNREFYWRNTTFHSIVRSSDAQFELQIEMGFFNQTTSNKTQLNTKLILLCGAAAAYSGLIQFQTFFMLISSAEW